MTDDVADDVFARMNVGFVRRTMQPVVHVRPRTVIEDRDAASLARHWSAGFRHGAYDRLATEAASDPDAADFLAAGMGRFVPTYAARQPWYWRPGALAAMRERRD